MTAQEAYEKIRAHFTKPDAVFSWDESKNNCVYRKDGDPASPVRCAVGVLIPDKFYDVELEENSIDMLLDNLRHGGPIWLRDLLPVEAFLNDAQTLHDWGAWGVYDARGNLHNTILDRLSPAAYQVLAGKVQPGVAGFVANLDELADTHGLERWYSVAVIEPVKQAAALGSSAPARSDAPGIC